MKYHFLIYITTVIIIICLFYHFSSKSTNYLYRKQMSEHFSDTNNASLMITSDGHFDPYYSSDVSRWSDNPEAWYIRTGKKLDNPNSKDQCDSDPPISLLYKLVSNYSKVNNSNNIPGELRNFIFCGDTMAHKFKTSVESIKMLMDNVFDILLAQFSSNNIFYAPGNHDGVPNKIFFDDVNLNEKDINNEWAKILIDKKNSRSFN